MKIDTPMSENIANITPHNSLLSTDERFEFFGQIPTTIWLTGLSGSGKSTVGFALEKALMARGHACYVLDGDNVRHGLNRDLSFSPEDRKENIRRIAEVARLLNNAGLIVITAFISPYRENRGMAREIIGAENFVEVHLATDIATCERRDPKGLYAKARAGKITDFTGISAPYEPPLEPQVRLDTSSMATGECVERILTQIAPRFTK
jgi:adenylylsulfate kinase